MSFRPFVRQLGSQPGVQLNPLIDSSEAIGQADVADQIFGALARLTRGRIDEPFLVNRGNIFRATGQPASMRDSLLNEAKIQINDGLNAGALGAVVQRLIAADSVQRFALIRFASGATLAAVVTAGVITSVTVTAGGTGYQTGQPLEFSNPAGTGAVATVIAAAGVITGVTISSGGTGYAGTVTVRVANTVTVTTGLTIPGSGWDLALWHRDCFNDGVTIGLHADASPVGGSAANAVVSLRIIDPYSGETMHEVKGSLDPAAVDDSGASTFLPDLVAIATKGAFTLSVRTSLTATSDFGWYGRDTTGRDRWNYSLTPAILFTEGSLTYALTDYDAAISKLTSTNLPFGYMITGGSRSPALIGKLAQAAIDTNTILGVDIPGTSTPAAAITTMQGLGLDSHLVHAYYAPIEAFEPTNQYRETWGTAGFNIGLRCARNGTKNAKGFAPLNYPVAGKAFPLARQQMRQTQALTDSVLSDLASARINPVGYEVFTGGGRYVFMDSLTSADTTTSFRKLINVAEMSTKVDLDIATFARELIQLPMSEALRRMSAFVDRYLIDATASGWLQPSQNLPGGVPYVYAVARDAVKPDAMRVDYSVSYDGVARQVTLQQRLVR
jgi:hypothetical protein